MSEPLIQQQGSYSSQSRCGCPTDIILNCFPLLSFLHRCNNIRLGNEMGRPWKTIIYSPPLICKHQTGNCRNFCGISLLDVNTFNNYFDRKILTLSLLNVVRHSRVTPVNTNLYKGTITKI